MERNRQPNGDERRRRLSAGKCEDCGGDPFPKLNDYCWCPLAGEEAETLAKLKKIESLTNKPRARDMDIKKAVDALQAMKDFCKSDDVKIQARNIHAMFPPFQMVDEAIAALKGNGEVDAGCACDEGHWVNPHSECHKTNSRPGDTWVNKTQDGKDN